MNTDRDVTLRKPPPSSNSTQVRKYRLRMKVASYILTVLDAAYLAVGLFLLLPEPSGVRVSLWLGGAVALAVATTILTIFANRMPTVEFE